jgi:hypothetical protein
LINLFIFRFPEPIPSHGINTWQKFRSSVLACCEL